MPSTARTFPALETVEAVFAAMSSIDAVCAVAPVCAAASSDMKPAEIAMVASAMIRCSFHISSFFKIYNKMFFLLHFVASDNFADKCRRGAVDHLDVHIVAGTQRSEALSRTLGRH